jgi:hypothetical protein
MCRRKYQPSLPAVQPTMPELKHLICSCTIAGTVANNQNSFVFAINLSYFKPLWNSSLNDNDSPHSIKGFWLNWIDSCNQQAQTYHVMQTAVGYTRESRLVNLRVE